MNLNEEWERLNVLFIVDDKCGRGHVMRCASIRHDLAAMGVASKVWTGAAEEIATARVIVIDDYGLEWPAIAAVWDARVAPPDVVVIEDFDDERRQWGDDVVVIHPVGDYAIVRPEIRRLKGTPKEGSLLVLPGGPSYDFEIRLARAPLVSCAASVIAIEAAYLDCELDLRVDVANQQRTYDWLMSGGRPDGLGSVRIASLIKGMAES